MMTFEDWRLAFYFGMSRLTLQPQSVEAWSALLGGLAATTVAMMTEGDDHWRETGARVEQLLRSTHPQGHAEWERIIDLSWVTFRETARPASTPAPCPSASPAAQATPAGPAARPIRL